jgi:acyl-coenzyme A synthetase/AMP-(fatty) acid ligase
MRNESLSELLSGCQPATDCVALMDGRRISLSRLRSDVFHNAQRLEAREVRRAAVVCESGYWFIVGILALLKTGADAILPPNAQAGTLKSLAREIDTVLSDSQTARNPKELALEPSPAEVGSFSADFGKGRMYFFTSGSTGEMKRIEKSLAMFEHEAMLLERMWGAKLGEVPIMGTVTHQHVFGMTFRIMWPLATGRPFHSEFHIAWESLTAELDGPSMIVTSPAQLTRLGGLAPLRPEICPRLVITAGAPLPTAAADEAASIFGCAPIEIFGSTEAGIMAWRRSGTEPALWHPFPTVEVGATADGVLMLRSPHASDRGWTEHADKITLLADGRFRLEGRVDRVVKIEGKRVSLQRLERELTALPWVKEAAVVKIEGRRTCLGAVVQLSDAGVAEFRQQGKFRFERKLRCELSSTHDLAVLPRRWKFVDLMPVDGLGKRRVGDVVALLEQSS